MGLLFARTLSSSLLARSWFVTYWRYSGSRRFSCWAKVVRGRRGGGRVSYIPESLPAPSTEQTRSRKMSPMSVVSSFQLATRSCSISEISL